MPCRLIVLSQAHRVIDDSESEAAVCLAVVERFLQGDSPTSRHSIHKTNDLFARRKGTPK